MATDLGPQRPVEGVEPCIVDIPAEGEGATCQIPQLTPGSYVFVATTPDGIQTRRNGYAYHVDRNADAPPEELEPRSEERCEPVAGGETCQDVTEDIGFSSESRPVNLSVHAQHEYVQVGDRLRVAVRGPWNGRAGTLLVGEGGHLGRHPFVLRRGRAEIELLVDERWVGGVDLYAWLPRRGESKLPKLETARTSVSVSDASRTLAVAFDVAANATAGETFPVSLRVFDRDDAPVRQGRVSLWMVDEAVLDLTHYRMPEVRWSLGPAPEDESATHAFDDAVRKPFVARAEGPVAFRTPAGSLLALDIEVTADSATRFVVADVPLPAGLELVRTDLANQMHRMPIEGEQGDWVSHVERRSDRAIVYGDDLVPGSHRTTLFVRATAEGRYRWPGAHAAAMYDPAVEGWSESRTFEVTNRP